MKANGRCECDCGATTNLNQRGEPRRFLRGHNRRNVGTGWTQQGYVYFSLGGKTTAFHRYVFETYYGVTLERGQVVHHIDGNALNNDPENLAVMSISEHMRLHRLKDRSVRWTPDEDERLLSLRKSGLTIDGCARVLDRPYSSTRVRLAELNKRADTDTAKESPQADALSDR